MNHYQDELLASIQFNLLQHILAEQIAVDHGEQFQEISEWMWSIVGSDPDLLDWEEEDIREVVSRYI